MAGFLVLLGGLRVFLAYNVQFTSDEAQHLHVVWAWASGLLPYRDVFDNHTPVFHLLCAPLFRLFGENAMIIVYMRLAMIPLFAASLWFVFLIGRRLFSRRAGAWAAVFAGFFPIFLLKTVEFRTDDLWATVWLGLVAIAIGGRLTPRRMFGVGLILGLAFGVSMKTLILAAALLVAGGATLAWSWRQAGGGRAADVLRGLGAGAAGLLVVPAVLIAYFAAQHAAYAGPGAVGTLYYGAIGHNLLPGLHTSGGGAWRKFWFPAALLLSFPAAHFTLRSAPDRAVAIRRLIILLCVGFYLALLHGYWPMITGQDYLPVAPLFVVLVTPGILALGPKCAARWPWLPRLAVPVGYLVLEAAVGFKFAKVRRHSNTVSDVADVLRWTNRDDYVMDAKSGAIYRQRPFYYALEDVTMKGIDRGLIKNDIVERLIATRTCVAAYKRLSDRDLDFVRRNYLFRQSSYGIAGQNLFPDASGSVAFEIAISTTYALVSPQGEASGMLDGRPYRGKIPLDIGHHSFVADQPAQPLVLVWAQALERGFRPKFSANALPNEPKKK